MEKNTWEIVESMNVCRANAAVTVLNGYIYIAGGLNKHGYAISSVELYDPQTDEWTQLPPIPQDKTEHTVFELSGILHAIGGYDTAIRKFDPFKNCWKEVY